MKLLFKLALVALLAKGFLSIPKGSFKELDQMGDLTVRDVASHVVKAYDKAEKTVSLALADAPTTLHKARHGHSGAGRRQAD